MISRNDLKQQSILSNDPEILLKYKILRNRIKSKLKKEKDDYYTKRLLESNNDIKQLWKTSYHILGQSQDLSPKQLIYKDHYISSPQLMAEGFNEMFINRIQKVKANITSDISIHSVQRLTDWLSR